MFFKCYYVELWGLDLVQSLPPLLSERNKTCTANDNLVKVTGIPGMDEKK